MLSLQQLLGASHPMVVEAALLLVVALVGGLVMLLVEDWFSASKQDWRNGKPKSGSRPRYYK